MYDVLIKNGHVVLEEEVADVFLGIKDGKIAAILAPDSGAEAEKVLDCTGRYVLPGAIDPHSHVTFCDTFSNGSKSAAAGGITTIIEMPLSQRLPAVLNAEVMEERIRLGERECVGDFALWGGIQPGNYENAAALMKMGAAAFKVFMNYAGEDYKFFDDYALKTLMDHLQKIGGVVGIHAENESLCRGYSEYYRNMGCGAECYSRSRPVLAEEEAVSRACLYALDTGCKVHICHVSSPKVADIILEARMKGARISYETCPHYLTLTDRDIAVYGVYAKCNPPMRSKEEQGGLWKLMKDGLVDSIGSDHAAYSEEMKESGDFWSAPGGFPGNDVLVPTVLEEGISDYGLSWVTAAKILSTKPARIFGLDGRKGAIRVGMDADFMVIAPDSPWTFHAKDTYYGSRCSKYPYENRNYHMKVDMTMVRGRVIYQDGKIVVPDGYGRFVKSLQN